MGDKPLIHDDIKSANILLDKNFEGPQTQNTHIKVSRVLGTRPYLPDEYLRSKKISTKVDTYSFGIVLFELGTGLRAYDSHREHPYLRDQIENSGQRDLRDVKAGQVCVALYQPLMGWFLGWLCASSKAKERPEMVKVLQDLDELASKMEFYIGHRTPQPQPTVPPPAVLPPVLVPSPRLPPRDKVVDVFPPSPRDKVVPVLLPSPVRQVLEPSIEHLVMPQMNPVPQPDVSPSVLPTPISLLPGLCCR